MRAPPGPRARHPDTIVAAVILVVAAAAFATTLGFDTIPESLMEGMGPERFPQLVIAVMAGLALLLLWRSRGRTAEPLPRIPPMAYATVLLLAATVFVLPWLGIVPTMTVAMFALGWLWGERRVWLLLPVTLLFAAGVQFLFVRTLGITLPVGPFGFLLG